MKKLLLIITLLFTSVCYAQVSSIPVPSWTTIRTAATFHDANGHVYEESIFYLKNKWVVIGYPDGTFWPDRTITRAEMMKIVLFSLLWKKELDWKNCFPDVQDDWYAPYVCYGKDNNIVRWYPNWNFGPENNVTFAEGLKIALEAYDSPVKEWSWNLWHKPYFDYINSLELFSTSQYFPDNLMTRWEMAYLIHQMELLKKWEKLTKLVIPVEPVQTVTSANNDKWISQWCWKLQPNNAPTSSLVNWVKRNYITVVWRNYNKDVPTKLIFAFHWRTNSNKQVQQYYGIDKASNWNAIIVYPLWLPEWWPSRSRNTDFAIFDTLYKELTDTYCIDLDEVYSMWHSLWAWYTNTLACARADVIRATWSVWGWITAKECTWYTASLIMHNPEDRLAAFSSWVVARDHLLKQNECWAETKPVWPSRWNCVEYTTCTQPVTWCPHSDSTSWNWSYYPHTRPDTAGQEIREFFNKHE